MKTFYQVLINTVMASVINMTVWFGLAYFVYLSTKSVMAASWLSASYLVMTVLTGIWFGSIVDHHHKKAVMLWSGIVSTIAYLIGMWVYISAPSSAFTTINSSALWAFIAVLIVGVIAGNMRNIALPTLVTLLIPEDKRDRANGMVGTSSGLSFLVTSVISGYLVSLGGMLYVLGVGILVSSISLLHLMMIQIEEMRIVHIPGQGRKVDLRGTYLVISKIPGLLALILFTTINNFLGGVFMALMDAYGLSMVSVEVWGLLWGSMSLAFILGGIMIVKFGLGAKPTNTLMIANVIVWIASSLFTIYPSIFLLVIGSVIYLAVVPYIEASEQTIMQKLVPKERQGRVFGFAQSVEQTASPVTAFVIGPLTELLFIPFMTTGIGASILGPWLGVGPARGIALVFTIFGIIGLIVTLLAWNSRYYHRLTNAYANHK